MTRLTQNRNELITSIVWLWLRLSPESTPQFNLHHTLRIQFNEVKGAKNLKQFKRFSLKMWETTSKNFAINGKIICQTNDICHGTMTQGITSLFLTVKFLLYIWNIMSKVIWGYIYTLNIKILIKDNNLNFIIFTIMQEIFSKFGG